MTLPLVLLTLCSPGLPPALADDTKAMAGPTEPVEASGRFSTAEDTGLVEGSFRIDRGEEVSLWIPPGEMLEFRVDVDLGVIGDASVGEVTMSSGLEPFVAGLPVPGQKLDRDGKLVAWTRITAEGGHLGYELEHSITTRFLPQSWPSQINTEVQKGSENRRRELKIGVREGKWSSSYRGDGHCRGCERREHFVKSSLPWGDDHHCKKCKRGEHRLWRTPVEAEVPEQSIDILGAVYLARSLVREGHEELELSMLQHDDLWKVTLKQGVLKPIAVKAGTYSCRQVVLEVQAPEGREGKAARFSGLFGIRGALQIWLHEGTGVPVLIEGDVPLGDLLELHVSVRLAKHRGTPEAFQGVR